TQEQYAKVVAGMAGGTGAAPAASGDLAKGRAANRSASRRNIANTYVWTAQGGFFSETTSTTDQVTETHSGSYSMSHAGAFSAMFSIGLKISSAKVSLDVSAGGGYSLTRTKSGSQSRTFSLDVACNPERALQKLNGGTPVLRPDGTPVLAPGRVDAYRFMTFYLDANSDNFEDFYGKVIDPEWLDGTEPGALALNQARQTDHKPPCWRIMHRVTFVSRILPDATVDTGDTALQKAMRTLNITSNYTLATQLDPLIDPAATVDPDSLQAVLPTVLAAAFPQLLPHTREILDILAPYYNLPIYHPAAAVTPAPASTLTTSSTTVTKGTPLTLRYSTTPENLSVHNWIGLTPAAQTTAHNALVWQYAPDATGAVTLATTALPGPGAYKAWYLHNNDYTPLGAPLTFTVT
ncbi:MAG: hypothetical protein ABIS86_24590, partial [Streptosporangiaceae bacterium]